MNNDIENTTEEDKDKDKEVNPRHFKYIRQLEINTNIEWWNNNRKEINEVIVLFNDWQTKFNFDEKLKNFLLERIRELRDYGSNHSFSKWQYDIIAEMENYIELN